GSGPLSTERATTFPSNRHPRIKAADVHAEISRNCRRLMEPLSVESDVADSLGFCRFIVPHFSSVHCRVAAFRGAIPLLRTVSPGIEPCSHCRDKLFMGNRRNAPTGAGIPSPVHERIFADVLDQLSWVFISVGRWVSDTPAQFADG